MLSRGSFRIFFSIIFRFYFSFTLFPRQFWTIFTCFCSFSPFYSQGIDSSHAINNANIFHLFLFPQSWTLIDLFKDSFLQLFTSTWIFFLQRTSLFSWKIIIFNNQKLLIIRSRTCVPEVYSKTKCSSSNIFCFRSCLSVFRESVFVCLAHLHSSFKLSSYRRAYRQCQGSVSYRRVENVSHGFLRLSPLQYHQHGQEYFICNFRISRFRLKLSTNFTIFFDCPISTDFMRREAKFRRFSTIFSTSEHNFPIYRIFNFADDTNTSTLKYWESAEHKWEYTTYIHRM